jgi:carbon monoxide dehydrogenase subunit G
MRLEHSFEVGVPIERAWDVLLDIEQIAPCMPGAALSEFDGESFTGMVKVKLGPVSLSYKGKGRFVERDEAARKVVIKASGQDSRGAGAAAATVTAQLHVAGDASTRVDVVTDLDISGKAAQFGRGMIGDVSSKLLGQFVDCLTTKLATEAPTRPPTPTPGAAAPSATSTAEPVPIDLLAVSGASAARRIGPYVLGVVVLGLVIWGLVAWLG